jgi:hypothetical protein
MAVLPASAAAVEENLTEAVEEAGVETGVASMGVPQKVQNEVAAAFSLPQAEQVITALLFVLR